MIPGLGKSTGEGIGYPTPIFWSGEFHGLYSPRGHKELDMTERLSLHFTTGWCVIGNCLVIAVGNIRIKMVSSDLVMSLLRIYSKETN